MLFRTIHKTSKCLSVFGNLQYARSDCTDTDQPHRLEQQHFGQYGAGDLSYAFRCVDLKDGKGAVIQLFIQSGKSRNFFPEDFQNCCILVFADDGNNSLGFPCQDSVQSCGDIAGMGGVTVFGGKNGVIRIGCGVGTLDRTVACKRDGVTDIPFRGVISFSVTNAV